MYNDFKFFNSYKNIIDIYKLNNLNTYNMIEINKLVIHY